MRPGKRNAVGGAILAPVLAAALAVALAGCSPKPEVAPKAAPTRPEGFDAMRAQAVDQGSVRVIIQVAMAPGDSAPLMSRAAMAGELSKGGVAVSYPLTKDLPLLVAEVTPAQLDAMADSGRIAAIMEDRLSVVDLGESVKQIRAPEAWAKGALGAGQAVAILDTGVDAQHPFFGGRVVAEACFSSISLTFNAESVCPNGADSQIGAGAAAPCRAFGCDHGTHVAGIAAGSGPQFRGVAPQADIVAVQVFSLFRDSGARQPCAGSGQRSPCIASFTSDQIRALDYVRRVAADRPVAAVNMSLGGGKSAGACDGDFIVPSILQLRALGVATAIAAGNDGYPDAVSYPGCVAGAVTVGAVDRSDTLAAFSNRGPLVDVLAPGLGIQSSVPGGLFAAKSGTSMATPHVAGAFAALKSIRPGASLEELTFALASTGKDVGGRPRIDVAAALASLPVRAPTRADAPILAFAAATTPSATAQEALLRDIAKRPANQPIRMLVRPRWTADILSQDAQAEAVARVAAAARSRGARLVDPRVGQGLVVVEATPAQLQSLSQSRSVGAMQEEIRATPQAN